MLTTEDYLFITLSEEAGEVIQAASKCNKFGKDDKPPAKPKRQLQTTQSGMSYSDVEELVPNTEYLVRELNDLLGTIKALEIAGINLKGVGDKKAINAKVNKIRKWAEYSYLNGRVHKDHTNPFWNLEYKE